MIAVREVPDPEPCGSQPRVRDAHERWFERILERVQDVLAEAGASGRTAARDAVPIGSPERNR